MTVSLSEVCWNVLMVANRFDYLHFNVPMCSICQGCADSLFYSNPPAFVSLPFSPRFTYIPLSSPRVSPSSPFVFLPSPSCLSSCYLFLFPHSTLPLSLHRVTPVAASRFHLSLYSYPSSLISPVFLSPVMLSSLPSYPSCLISSHPTFRSPFHPFPRASV